MQSILFWVWMRLVIQMHDRQRRWKWTSERILRATWLLVAVLSVTRWRRWFWKKVFNSVIHYIATSQRQKATRAQRARKLWSVLLSFVHHDVSETATNVMEITIKALITTTGTILSTREAKFTTNTVYPASIPRLSRASVFRALWNSTIFGTDIHPTNQARRWREAWIPRVLWKRRCNEYGNCEKHCMNSETSLLQRRTLTGVQAFSRGREKACYSVRCGRNVFEVSKTTGHSCWREEYRCGAKDDVGFPNHSRRDELLRGNCLPCATDIQGLFRSDHGRSNRIGVL